MSHVAGMDVSLSTSILGEKQVSGIVDHISEYPLQNLETRSWNIINDGGVRCKAKATNKDEVETGEGIERKITEPFEDIQEPNRDVQILPGFLRPQFETIYEECFTMDHIVLFEDVDPIGMGCTFATDADLVEILAINLLDELDEKEKMHAENPEKVLGCSHTRMSPMMKRLLSKEFEVNEKMEHHHVEEEDPLPGGEPPPQFHGLLHLDFQR